MTDAAVGAHGSGGTGDRAADRYLPIDDFADWGVRALVTSRAAGSFSTASSEPVADVLGRWDALREHVAGGPAGRLATARQVHGAAVVEHVPGWAGWLRYGDADGHISYDRGTALAVSVADCVPVLLAHPGGAVAALHAGWRGTAAGILSRALSLMDARGLRAGELRVVLGPAICGECYEVSPDVHAQITGRTVSAHSRVDLREVLTAQARDRGVRDVRRSPLCTRCHNEQLYSHRAGDAGRQLAVIVADRAGS